MFVNCACDASSVWTKFGAIPFFDRPALALNRDPWTVSHRNNELKWIPFLWIVSDKVINYFTFRQSQIHFPTIIFIIIFWFLFIWILWNWHPKWRYPDHIIANGSLKISSQGYLPLNTNKIGALFPDLCVKLRSRFLRLIPLLLRDYKLDSDETLGMYTVPP